MELMVPVINHVLHTMTPERTVAILSNLRDGITLWRDISEYKSELRCSHMM